MSSAIYEFVEPMRFYYQMRSELSISPTNLNDSFIGEVILSTPKWEGPPKGTEYWQKTVEKGQKLHYAAVGALALFLGSLFVWRRSEAIRVQLLSFCGTVGGGIASGWTLNRARSYVNLSEEETLLRFQSEASGCTDFPKFVRQVCSYRKVDEKGTDAHLDPMVISQYKFFEKYPFKSEEGDPIHLLLGHLAKAVVECDQVYAAKRKSIDSAALNRLKGEGVASLWSVLKDWTRERSELDEAFQFVEGDIRHQLKQIELLGLGDFLSTIIR
ncbi:MAG: hypothetical protein AB7F31_07210 [Parachlamydiales bacterium]